MSLSRADMARCVGALLCWAVVCGPACRADGAATQPEGSSAAARLDSSLRAHWTFDEPVSPGKPHASSAGVEVNVEPNRSVERVRGVHGGAWDLSGNYQLRVATDRLWDGLEQITFTAWTRPTDLSSYREIFRQECPNRVLFSYQNNGTILSLGLNVGGYVECDAPIQPSEVLDGQWHHAAASFDGHTMRVYLDGREIGSLARQGTLNLQTDAPAFVGSSSGHSEFFHGGLDDLRIYAAALTAEQIAQLYQHGVQTLANASVEIEAQLARFYCDRPSFTGTLAESRQRLADSGAALDRELGAAVLAKLKARFPQEYQQFFEWTGASPLEYLSAPGSEFHLRHVGRLMDLLLEYRPLTAAQWAKVTDAERARWEEADRLVQRYAELKSRGDAAQYAPDWLDLIFAAGPHIQFRPVVSEAVAPYVKPETPLARSLSGEEARQALERDWLHQADQKPTPERIRQEIEWARALADRISRSASTPLDFTGELAQLDALSAQAAAVSAPDPELYFRVRGIKRQIAFRNPVLDFDQLLFVDMPFPQGSEWPHETRHRLGYMAVPGARLLVLRGLNPAGELRQLMPQAPLHGSFWRPDVSWDARKVLFCFKPHNEKSFHLYEIDVDGANLRQLTDGPFDDLDPIYLQDDQQILFSTTRGHTYVRCMPPTNAFVLARCDREGKNIYLVSRNNEPDYLPSVMNDGRVVYTRWEYTDKPLWRAQKLWTMNPDGTQVNTLWGNQSVWPDLLKDARSIPNSQRVMFTGSAHHNWFAGSVGILDPTKGYNFPDGLTKVTADVEWPESGNGPVDPIESPAYHASGKYAGYYSPYPLSERDFLVSANRGGKFVLYLMDADGNRELIYEGAHNIFHAIPLRPRSRPPQIPDRVAWPSREERLSPQQGVIYSSNVYEGAPPELAGHVRYLRVLNIDPKTYTYWHKRPYISTGPVVSMVQSEGVKRVLGTVPIEVDGSVAFRAPSGMALHFQLLDDQQRALHTMRSFTGVMPGEIRGCVGCHESHSRAPEPYTQQALAMQQPPRDITPVPWPDDTVSYDRYVQPVLDRYCVQCHETDPQANAALSLARRPGFLTFDEPYVTLIGRPSWGKPYEKPENPPPGWGIAGMLMVEAYHTVDPEAYKTPPAMSALSYKSRLIELASSGQHYDVRVDPISLQRLILWVDTMCPYLGEEEVRAIPDPVFQGVDWLAIRPRVQTAPVIVRPGPVD